MGLWVVYLVLGDALSEQVAVEVGAAAAVRHELKPEPADAAQVRVHPHGPDDDLRYLDPRVSPQALVEASGAPAYNGVTPQALAQEFVQGGADREKASTGCAPWARLDPATVASAPAGAYGTFFKATVVSVELAKKCDIKVGPLRDREEIGVKIFNGRSYASSETAMYGEWTATLRKVTKEHADHPGGKHLMQIYTFGRISASPTVASGKSIYYALFKLYQNSDGSQADEMYDIIKQGSHNKPSTWVLMNYLLQMTEAIEVMALAGWIHRDLKTTNWMVLDGSRSNQGMVVAIDPGMGYNLALHGRDRSNAYSLHGPAGPFWDTQAPPEVANLAYTTIFDPGFLEAHDLFMAATAIWSVVETEPNPRYTDFFSGRRHGRYPKGPRAVILLGGTDRQILSTGDWCTMGRDAGVAAVLEQAALFKPETDRYKLGRPENDAARLSLEEKAGYLAFMDKMQAGFPDEADQQHRKRLPSADDLVSGDILRRLGLSTTLAVVRDKYVFGDHLGEYELKVQQGLERGLASAAGADVVEHAAATIVQMLHPDPRFRARAAEVREALDAYFGLNQALSARQTMARETMQSPAVARLKTPALGSARPSLTGVAPRASTFSSAMSAQPRSSQVGGPLSYGRGPALGQGSVRFAETNVIPEIDGN